MERKNNENNNCVVISVGREELTLGLADATVSSNFDSESKKTRGFHLSRSKWDPYPWVGSVEKDSIADSSGLRPGDCLLKVDGIDLLGLRMQDIATLIGRDNQVNLQIWRRPRDELFAALEDDKDTEINDASLVNATSDSNKSTDGGTAVALQGPLPEVAHKLASTISGVVKTLECPVCLESSAPPVSQCVHGHILCVGCRPKTERCPVCRVRLGQGRCLLADKFHRILQENFSISPAITRSTGQNYSLHERLFGCRKNKNKERSDTKPSSSKSKHLLSRLLPSRNDGKASSTESLPEVTAKSLPNGRDFLLKKTFGEQLDRAKSASTGELTGQNRDGLNNTTILNVSGSFLSVPPTPRWGGSTESISDWRFNCPVNKTGCHEKVTSGTAMEHLVNFHNGPFVHFYGTKLELPYPLPFGCDAIFILHCFEDLFFLQNTNLSFWMNGVILSGKKWEWTIKAHTNSETIEIVKEVINLQESSIASLEENTIVLPELCYYQLNVNLSELKVGERFKV